MSRRDNVPARCGRCHVHRSLCFCPEIPRLVTRTRLLLVIHYREQRKPTNTGSLAAECLTNSTVLVRGHSAQRECSLDLDPTATTLVLFPHEHAQPLTDFAAKQPITLVVPDGNWRQASKVRTRIPELTNAPLVSLPVGPPSNYALRHESQAGGLATLEAIARAFGILEGAAVQAQLERVLRIMVERTLWARGALRDHELSYGLPVGAVRHDPLSGTERPPA